MYNDIIKSLNLEEFNIKIKNLSVSKNNNILYCYITLESISTFCPLCNSNHILIKDYRAKKINHSISTNNPCIIVYNARRYKCKTCDNIFYERNPFTIKSNKLSTYTIITILDRLKSHTKTFTDVANELHLSHQTVINVFDKYVDYHRTKLPNIICFDEIYTSRKSYNKYVFIMADFFKSHIIEMYSSRHKNYLTKMFSSISTIEREKVEYIIIDMWDTYRDLAEIYFKKAKIAVDSFHVIKHLNEAIISIRLKIMRKYDNDKSLFENDLYYYMLKKFHYFFVKNYDDIYDGLIEIRKLKTKWYKHNIRDFLLSIDPDLKYAYELKERYREFNLIAEYDKCDEEFNELIEEFLNSHLEEYRDFGEMLNNWKPYIKNSFIRINDKRLSNGPMEGINSRIKTIMKAANGFRNFNRFRNRVIYSINKNVPIKGTPIKKK